MGQADCLVESIYSAATEPGLWPGVLAEVRSQFQIAAINLIFFDPAEGRPPFMLESGHDPAALALWQLRAGEDPHVAAGMQRPGQVIWSQEVMPARAYALNPFVNEVLRIGGLFHVLGMLLVAKDASFGVGVHRPHHRPFVPADAERLEPVLRHLQRAMQVHYRLSVAEGERQSLADLLDQLRAGALLLGTNGAVVLANRAARAMARANDGLTLGRAVAGATPAVTRTLRLAIARVATGAASAALPLPRPSGREPYHVLIVPLSARGTASRVGNRRAVALALVTDPDLRLVIAPDVLRSYLDLTPAEARVTAEIFAGRTTDQIAARVGASRNTVRVHVRHILAKTGAASRAELIAGLVAKLPQLLLAEPVS